MDSSSGSYIKISAVPNYETIKYIRKSISETKTPSTSPGIRNYTEETRQLEKLGINLLKALIEVSQLRRNIKTLTSICNYPTQIKLKKLACSDTFKNLSKINSAKINLVTDRENLIAKADLYGTISKTVNNKILFYSIQINKIKPTNWIVTDLLMY